MCRNVLIYFNTNLQNKTLKLFNESLKENAFLMLGAHESVIGLSEAFFSKKNKYYIKK
jgi:chemotaxis methyl-accepting protein methylase